jgi:5-methylcytosine-specific restriction protein A
MPTAPLPMCRQPRCPNRVTSGFCAQHKPARSYDRRRWRGVSKAFLAEYPLCGMRPNGLAPVMSKCYDQDRTTLAVAVDHVQPHKGDDELFWDLEANGQSMCRVCHGRKSGARL